MNPATSSLESSDLDRSAVDRHAMDGPDANFSAAGAASVNGSEATEFSADTDAGSDLVVLGYDGSHEQMMQPYRVMSRGAIVSLVMTLLSLPLVFFSPAMLFFPLVGIAFGVFSLFSIRRYPAELSGKGVAIAGMVGSLLIFVGGVTTYTAIYLTEVPEGYERISFNVLRPAAGMPETAIPQEAFELNGKQIFVKGYVHPSISGLGPVRQFVMVPDLGTCCFGGQPALTDMIEVTVPDNQRVKYSTRKRKIAGTLKVNSHLKKVDGLTGVFYQLNADHAR